MKTPRVLIPLAEGFEEIEATTAIDVLRRAGLEVVTAGIPSVWVMGSRRVKVMADRKMEDMNPEEFDCLVLVGGSPGYVNLGRSNTVLKAIQSFDRQGKTIGAICAAPSVLAKAGILHERRATIYPGMEGEIPRPRTSRVVTDGHVITSQGPGTAIEFSLKLVEALAGKPRADRVRRELVA
jgi:4-methyl-5(b-hydroxyethyl)-thiazole monophosphate biosynthesis